MQPISLKILLQCSVVVLLLVSLRMEVNWTKGVVMVNKQSWIWSPNNYNGQQQQQQQYFYFDTAAQDAFSLITTVADTGEINNIEKNRNELFDLSTWGHRTNGGLLDDDRQMIANYYSQASSVFEYGLGESTYIASAVQVPRYAGIDSDIVWIDLTKNAILNQSNNMHFRFYYGDIGTSKSWGYPTNATLEKIQYQYQVSPLQAELYPFDVYMVDGRYRIACVLLSFLHYSSTMQKKQLQLKEYSTGASIWPITPTANTTTTTTTTTGGQSPIVLLHDCWRKQYSTIKNPPPARIRPEYDILDNLLTLTTHSTKYLCVYTRPPNITDEQIYQTWLKYRDVVV